MICDPQLETEVVAAAARHEERFSHRIRILSYALHEAYRKELAETLKFLVLDRCLGDMLAPSREVLEQFLLSHPTITPRFCRFAAPLDLDPVAEGLPAVLTVCAATRLLHDRSVQTPAASTRYDTYLFGRGLEAPEARALEVMIGVTIILAAVKRLRERKLFQAATAVLRLVPQIQAGFIVKALRPAETSVPIGSRVNRSAIAGEMLPYLVLLADVDDSLRAILLECLAALIALRESRVGSGSYRSAKTSPPDRSRPAPFAEATRNPDNSTLEAVWRLSAVLPPVVRDAVAAEMTTFMEGRNYEGNASI